MRQREQYDTFLEEQKFVVCGLFIECHTENQGAAKFHIKQELPASVSNSESGLLHLWFFQTVPTCLIDIY